MNLRSISVRFFFMVCMSVHECYIFAILSELDNTLNLQKYFFYINQCQMPFFYQIFYTLIRMIPFSLNQTNPNNSEQHNSSQNQNNVSSFQSQSLQDQQHSQLQPQQIQKALKTLAKLKKISKKKHLTDLKYKNKRVNAMFKQMSYFFSFKQQQLKKQRKLKKKLQQARYQAKKLVGMRRKENTLSPILQPQTPKLLQESQISQNNQDSKYKFQLKSLSCYVCKTKYTQIHHFYDYLCIPCGDLNYQKRNMKADFTGMVALVTGARIKIGYQIALKLLRDNATVIATTRFFKDAFLRYQKQTDFQSFKSRLYIIQCDFTSSSQVSKLIAMIKNKFSKLDILINNAAQTIVRPKQFYLTQILNQQKQILSLPPHIAQFQDRQQKKSQNLIQKYPSLFLPQQSTNNNLLMLQNKQSSKILLNFDCQKSKIDHNQRDQFNQPTDKRDKNTWTQKLDQVTLTDCFTTQLVNSIVPFHLIGQLKPLMIKKPQQTPSYIINVSSMQGVFYRSGKQANHPHTNMAKAALNMITRTSGRDFVKDNIYMNSVDTGWVTQQNPYSFKIKNDTERLVPLDCVDGAMRVLDPIYQSLDKKINTFGKFIKDYKQSHW